MLFETVEEYIIIDSFLLRQRKLQEALVQKNFPFPYCFSRINLNFYLKFAICAGVAAIGCVIALAVITKFAKDLVFQKIGIVLIATIGVSILLFIVFIIKGLIDNNKSKNRQYIY
jgi:hypothetical protein